MAKTILAPSLSERVYTGTHGNESVAEGVFTVNAAEADSVIHLLSLPIGVRINALQLVSTKGLGGTATVSVKSGEHELIGDSGAVTASFTRYVPVEPYTTQRDGELVTVTIKTAAATGTLNVLLRYTVVGY
ncbi:hypothetical protein ACNEV0_004830 [Escherichia coli]|uniref:Uncharacterized protein n=3 Tax=root TaxID=1 RepID=A0A088CD63_9CAUD|nr:MULTISPECIES: hypothetical protein [Enterobacteriaceae]YP_009100274.1 virion structural protein [Shigella phage POCJ13]EEQ6463700.1 hypothetical protein [Escherichia coli O157:H7]EFF6093962.1 hypothetical protein [Escherichia coli O157]EGA7216418.1 hypothetical protein [Shigella sonnei]AHZ95218.1 hypothetical protein [Shigella phage POCJ13]ALL90405.1 hypothetical protein MJ49_23675 [Escherichia coli]